MRSRLTLSFAVAVLFCGSVAHAQVQAARPSAPPTIQKPVAPSKVDGFLKIVQNAATLAEVQKAFDGAGFTKAEVEQVKKRTDESPQLKAKLEDLLKQSQAARKAQVAEFERGSGVRMAALSKKLNEQRIAKFKTTIASARQQIGTKPPDPATTCKADAPAVKSVSSVTPGVEFAVQGVGFGEYPGTVELSTGGKVFGARVNGWNSCVIYAVVGDDVSGVGANAQASVSVRTTEGKLTRGLTGFTPSLETAEQSANDAAVGYYLGRSKDWKYWDYVLKNDWYVVDTKLEHFHMGHAEITSAPPNNVPNAFARTYVHAGVAGLGASEFTVTQSLAGPKGLQYK